jgi:uncharacterized protein YbaR (Trm112 family)
MSLDPQLLEILVCPNDRGDLDYREDESVLVCTTCGYRYPIRDDIPVMLIDEATTVDDAEHGRILAKVEAEGLQPTFSP